MWVWVEFQIQFWSCTWRNYVLVAAIVLYVVLDVAHANLVYFLQPATDAETPLPAELLWWSTSSPHPKLYQFGVAISTKPSLPYHYSHDLITCTIWKKMHSAKLSAIWKRSWNGIKRLYRENFIFNI